MKKLLSVFALMGMFGTVHATDLNDINSLQDLVKVGFSQVDAQKILDAKAAGMVFTSSQDLLKISGITQGDLNRVRANLTVNNKPITTKSGTAPAIPGVSKAIPNSQAKVKSTKVPEVEVEDEHETEIEHDAAHVSKKPESSSKSSSSKSSSSKSSSGSQSKAETKSSEVKSKGEAKSSEAKSKSSDDKDDD